MNNRLSVIDDPKKYKNMIGLNLFDDNGKQIRPICLIKHGKIQNILSVNNGASRRENYNKNTIPRMRSTFILPHAPMDLDQISKKYDKCIIITHVYSGSCEYLNGNYCMIGHGQLVVKGNVVSVLSNVKITASIKDHLENIGYIGSDFEIFASACSKIGHVVKVCMGGPSISFNGATIEGGQYV